MTVDVEQSWRVHEFLLSPLAYPDKPKHVELKETHISWVYLTDRFVYKQKKPVAFEFLDFSTPECRKHFCQQEVELNRRLAPDVYLGTVPVCINELGDLQLKAGKEPIEWLVKMKKLNEATTLEAFIQNETLTANHVAGLAQRLTEFYTAQAPVMMRSGEFLASLTEHVQANRNDLLVCLPKAESVICYVTNAQLRCVSMQSNCFIQRVADGRIVDGHGDLRPEHIYYSRAKPLIIDCIEFNDEYRKNDVIDELAFLAMECDRIGNRDVGTSVLSAYAAASSDDCPPFLANFYKCYRACVRAKVAALRAAQSSGDAHRKAVKQAEAYIEHARGYADGFSPRLVILVGGLSGTGKSTLANALGDGMFAESLQTDLIRRELFDPGQENGKYSPTGRNRVYEEMFHRIEDCLRLSPTVVLDGTFSSRRLREIACAKAKSLGAQVLQVQCRCPSDVACNRIAHRIEMQQDASEATPDLPSFQQRHQEPPLRNEPLLHVDTTMDLADQVTLVETSVRSLTGD